MILKVLYNCVQLSVVEVALSIQSQTLSQLGYEKKCEFYLFIP